MNPTYFGDSYDLVKRFFCGELSALGYTVVVNPMLTGNWNGTEQQFYRLIGASPHTPQRERTGRVALLPDPDTGVHQRASKQHISLQQLTLATSSHALVFSFDQSFSRQAKPGVAMREKLATIEAQGCHGMYYDSHARFLFAAANEEPLHELRAHLVSLSLPASRLLKSGT